MQIEAHHPVEREIGILRSDGRPVNLAIQRHHERQGVLRHRVRTEFTAVP